MKYEKKVIEVRSSYELQQLLNLYPDCQVIGVATFADNQLIAVLQREVYEEELKSL